VTNYELSLQDANAQFDFGEREDFDKGLNELIGFPNDEMVPPLRPNRCRASCIKPDVEKRPCLFHFRSPFPEEFRREFLIV